MKSKSVSAPVVRLSSNVLYTKFLEGLCDLQAENLVKVKALRSLTNVQRDQDERWQLQPY